MRKVALRLGELMDYNGWLLKQNTLKQLLNKSISLEDLQDNDFDYNVKQKGVDIRIGLDIASLAYKKTCTTNCFNFRG